MVSSLELFIPCPGCGEYSCQYCENWCGLFFSTDLLMEAKKILWNFANCTNRPSDRQKAADNCLDMLKNFEKCYEKQIPLPHFVLYEPDEVTVIAGESSATLTRKVNELCVKFDNYVLSKRNPLPSVSQAPTQSSKPSFAVILKNPPKTLNDPKDRQTFIDKLCGDSK